MWDSSVNFSAVSMRLIMVIQVANCARIGADIPADIPDQHNPPSHLSEADWPERRSKSKVIEDNKVRILCNCSNYFCKNCEPCSRSGTPNLINFLRAEENDKKKFQIKISKIQSINCKTNIAKFKKNQFKTEKSVFQCLIYMRVRVGMPYGNQIRHNLFNFLRAEEMIKKIFR